MVEPIIKEGIISDGSLCEYGKVIAVGKDVKDIKEGDTIGFLIWGVNHLTIDDKKYYFIQEDPRFILGKIEDEK